MKNTTAPGPSRRRARMPASASASADAGRRSRPARGRADARPAAAIAAALGRSIRPIADPADRPGAAADRSGDPRAATGSRAGRRPDRVRLGHASAAAHAARVSPAQPTSPGGRRRRATGTTTTTASTPGPPVAVTSRSTSVRAGSSSTITATTPSADPGPTGPGARPPTGGRDGSQCGPPPRASGRERLDDRRAVGRAGPRASGVFSASVSTAPPGSARPAIAGPGAGRRGRARGDRGRPRRGPAWAADASTAGPPARVRRACDVGVVAPAGGRPPTGGCADRPAGRAPRHRRGGGSLVRLADDAPADDRRTQQAASAPRGHAARSRGAPSSFRPDARSTIARTRRMTPPGARLETGPR